jgi:hypothetical protein
MVADEEVVRRHWRRWTHRAVTRSRAHDPNRKPWDPPKFMQELSEDDPGLPFATVVDVTERFERCVNRANGSSSRLNRLLDSELSRLPEPVTELR